MIEDNDTSTPSMKPLGELVSISTGSASHATETGSCHPRMAEDRAKLMLRAFPTPGRDFDAGVITAAVIRLFCDYPEATVRAVSDPVKGLPSRLRYFPTIAEVKDALEAIEAPKRARQAADDRIRETRKLLSAPVQQATDEERERAVARWEAERDALRGRKNPEEARAAADSNLREGWRAKKWDLTASPVKVSEALRRNLEARAEPDFTPLGSGNGRAGR